MFDVVGDVAIAPEGEGVDLGVEVADVAIAPEGLDLGVEVGVVGTQDGDTGDDVTDFSSSDLSETALADVLV